MGRYVDAVYKECPTIKLQTKGGDAVANFVSPVATSMVPYPGIMVWGNRCFIWAKNEFDNDNKVAAIIYREDLAWALQEGSNCEQLEMKGKDDATKTE